MNKICALSHQLICFHRVEAGTVALLLLLSGSPVQAGGEPGKCSAYAHQAVGQNEDNLRRGCGYSGARWQSNYDNHYNWCMVDGWMMDGTTHESRARAEDLSKCKPKENKVEFCNSYARNAVRQNTENQQRACGFGGDRWQSNFDAHYNWCQGAGKESVNSEQAARVQDLARCTTRTNPKPDDDMVACRQYARLSISDQNENIRRGCGYNTPEWHLNSSGHYNWCMAQGKETAYRMHDERMVKLSHCNPKQTGYQLYHNGRLVSGPDAAVYTLAQAQYNCSWNKENNPGIKIKCLYNGVVMR